MNATVAVDALQYQPALDVDQRYIGDGGADVDFRASSTSPRSIVLADGLLLSNFISSGWSYGPRWGVVQPEEIASIEVMYGPYSAEYSGNSIGGVVVIHTAMPDDFQAYLSASGFVQSFEAYGTDETYIAHSLHASLGDSIGRWSYFIAADRLETTSQPMSFGVARPARWVRPGATPTPVSGAYSHPQGYVVNAQSSQEVKTSVLEAKLAYNFTEDLQARLTIAYRDKDQSELHPHTFLRDPDGDPVHDGLVKINGQIYRVTTEGLGMAESRTGLLGLTLRGALGGGWEIEAAVSTFQIFKDSTRESDSDLATARAGGPGTLTREGGSGWWYFNIKLGHRHNLGWLGRRVLFGYQFSRYVLDHASYATSNWRKATRTRLIARSQGTTHTHAVFLENEWWLGDAWTLVLGARYEWWRAFDGTLAREFKDGTRLRRAFPERTESAFSPKATLSFAPTNDWLIKLSLALAYRFPTVGELYQGTLTRQGEFSSGFDPNLKPEKVFAKNLMIRRYFDHATITLNLWEQDVEHSIFRHRNWRTGVWIYENVDRVRSRGVELAIQTDDLLAPGLDVGFNVSYTHPEILENDAKPFAEGNLLPGVSVWNVNLFANYQVTDHLRLSGGLRYESDPYETMRNAEGEKANAMGFSTEFVLLNARATYEWNESFSLSVGVNNITDYRYYRYHPHMGRTFFAELVWQY